MMTPDDPVYYMSHDPLSPLEALISWLWLFPVRDRALSKNSNLFSFNVRALYLSFDYLSTLKCLALKVEP